MPEERPAPRFDQTLASVWLDTLRAFAALIVLLQHWRYLFFRELHTLPAHRKLYALPYLITTSGHGAVIVFFVLSGFLVGSSALRSFEGRHWSWSRYLTHRLVRLWVVLLPALLLGMILDFFRLRLSATGAVGWHIPWEMFLTNALFLQGTTFPAFESNAPLWSLSYEFWYYMLFPLALCALSSVYTIRLRALSVAAIVFIAFLVVHIIGVAVLALYPAWLLGATLHLVPRPSIPPMLRRTASGLFLACFFYAAVFKLQHPYLADLGLAAISALFIWLLLCDVRLAPQHRLYVRTSRSVAHFSYTLYLVHLPLLWLIAAAILPNGTWLPDLPHVALGLLLFAAVILYAWLVALVTELRTDTLRHWIEKRILHYH